MTTISIMMITNITQSLDVDVARHHNLMAMSGHVVAVDCQDVNRPKSAMHWPKITHPHESEQSASDRKLSVLTDSLRGPSVRIGTIQRRLPLPLRKDDTHESRSANIFSRTCKT